jgi:hypothetical protein
MAIQSKTLASVEHDWFAVRSDQPANAPLSQHKRAFYESAVAASIPANTSLVELERRFLQDETGLSTNSIPDLWSALVGNFEIDATGKTLDQIKFEFYIQNTT